MYGGPLHLLPDLSELLGIESFPPRPPCTIGLLLASSGAFCGLDPYRSKGTRAHDHPPHPNTQSHLATPPALVKVPVLCVPAGLMGKRKSSVCLHLLAGETELLFTCLLVSCVSVGFTVTVIAPSPAQKLAQPCVGKAPPWPEMQRRCACRARVDRFRSWDLGQGGCPSLAQVTAGKQSCQPHSLFVLPFQRRPGRS